VARHVGEHAYFAEILEQSVATFRLEQPTTSPLSAEKAKTLRSKKQTRLPAEKLAKFDDASSTSTSFGAKYVMEAEPGGAVRARYVDFVYQPIDDEDGRVTGIFVEGHDVTAQKEGEIALSNNAALREQFIAVLGHDLRNPLAAISGGMNLLLKTSLDEKAKAIVDLVRGSATRMAALIDNVMDLARGRLGGGLPMERSAAEQLEPLLGHVVAELQTSAPDRVIDMHIAVTESVECDRARIGQLVSNLVGNAIDHGAPDQPIQVTAATQDGWFEFRSPMRGNKSPPRRLITSSTPIREAPTGRLVKV
jgi:signal transduction histidine kinase